MSKKNKRILIVALILCVLSITDITFIKNDKYTKVNNIISVLFMDNSLIEKGIVENEN